MHQTLIWDCSRHVLRSALREYFPAAIRAFEDLDAPEALELLAAAPDPDAAAKLTKARIVAALKRAHRRNTTSVPQRCCRCCGRPNFGSRVRCSRPTPPASPARSR